MSATDAESAPATEARPDSAADEFPESVTMLSHSRFGPVANLKRRLEMEIEHIEKRHKSMLEQATTAFESMELGIAWLGQ